MKINKQGVSLIVLVITIIVMIILASSVIILLSNSGIIGRAEEAVDATNLQEVQNLAFLAWSEAYIDKINDETVDLEARVLAVLEANKINKDRYVITVTENGVTVARSTLGALVKSAEMYGTKVNYEANGITDWKVFYKQTVGTEEYVYLIASEKLAYDKVPTVLKTSYGATIAEATVQISDTDSRQVGQIYWSGDAPAGIAVASTAKDKWLAEWSNYASGKNAKCVSYFLDENIWSDFANTEGYKDVNGNSYVVGAIGTPTAEMFVASWNEIREATGNTTNYNKKLELVPNGTTGYYLNDITNTSELTDTYTQTISTRDPLYIWSKKDNSMVWLASPSGRTTNTLLGASTSYMSSLVYTSTANGVRPVVCLSSKIPAQTDANGNIVI